jgi:hypothetical protein
MRFPSSVLVGLGVVAACSPSESPARVTGSWGGPDAMVVASADSIRLTLSCSKWLFTAPVNVAADGKFTMDGVGSGVLGPASDASATAAGGQNPIHANGRISDSTMTLSLYTGAVTPNPANVFSFTLTRGKVVMLPAICRA